MQNNKVPTNSISFGTVIQLGQNTIDTKLDNATPVNNVRVYGTMPAMGSRVVLIWDDRRLEWVCVSSELTNIQLSGQSSGGASSFIQLTDTPSVYGTEGQVAGMGANNRLVWLNQEAGGSLDPADILASSPITRVLNPDGTVTIGITLDDFLQTSDVAGVFPIVTNVSDGQVLISFDESGIDHGDLTGLGDDDHILYATVADGRDAYRATRLTRSLSTSAGQPLRFNGTNSAQLTSDISFAFVTGDITDITKGLSVTDNKIGIALATTSGLELVENKLQVADTIAGNGLGIDSKILSVNTSGGLTKSSDNVVVDTAYDFTWNGNHTWNTGIARFNGTLQADTDLVFVGAQSITTTIDSLTLSPVASLILKPQNNIVNLDDNVVLKSDNYASQTTGMRVTWDGQGDFRYLFADEMHVKSFIADLEQALAGGQIIAKSVALLAQPFTVPNYGASVTIVVESFPGFPNAYVFQNDDTIAVRIFDRTSGEPGEAGSLEVSFLFGIVQSIGIDAEAKTQSWTFTRLDNTEVSNLPKGGTANASKVGGIWTLNASSLVVNEGTIVLDFGVSQNGYYEVSAVDGLLGANSPYAQTVTWGTHPWYDRVVRSRMGNLNGIFSAGQEYGLYAGNGTSNSNKYLRISDVAVELRNLTFNIYSGDNTVFRINPDVPSLALGSTIPTGYLSAEDGVWMGLDAGAYKVRIGNSTNYLRWTGTQLLISGTINILGIDNPQAIKTSEINNDANWTSVTNTSQLIDGAGLGDTALWGGINVPQRFWDAPVSGSGLYLTATHMGYYDSSNVSNPWLTYMDNAGNFYLNGDANHALTWNGTTLNVIGDIQAKNGSVLSIWLRPSTESLSIGSGIGYDAEDITYDSGYAGIFMGKRISTGKYTMRIGNNTSYIKYDGSQVYISGVVTVQEGSDIDPKRYRMIQIDINWINITDLGDGTIRLNRSGSMVNAEGNRYHFRALMPNELRTVVSKGHQDLTAYVFKNGTGYLKVPWDFDEPIECIGIDNVTGDTPEDLIVDVCFERTDRFYDDAYYTQTERDNMIVVGSLRLTSDFLRVDGVFGRAESASTIIGPGYITTASLSAISANLGSVTAGSITVGSINKLWLNVENDSLKLAIGKTVRETAPFRVYDTGEVFAGDHTGSLHFVPGSGLSVNGVINATGGSLGNLSISGILSLDSGSLRWSYSDGQYWGLISSWGIRYIDRNASASSATIRIARPANEAQGIIDIDMFTAASAKWDYAIHITDGGNSNNSYSSLFHGQSSVPGTGAVDRIYNAYTVNSGLGAPYSDGYYSDLAGGLWSDFDSSGVSFKGISRGGQPVAVFHQVGGGVNGPVVFAGSDQSYRAVYQAEISQPGQVAFYVDQNSMAPNSFTALHGGNGSIIYVSCILLRNHSGLPDDVKNSGAIVDPPDGYTVVYARNNLMRFRTKTSGGTLDPETTMT